MTRLMSLTLLIAVLALPLAGAAEAPASGSGEFKLMSSELVAGGRLELRHVFNGFGCTGGNVSPALSWSGAPAGTKSFAVTVYDPDAPTGSGWWHWVLIDIPAAVSALAAGAGDVTSGKAPKGSTQMTTDFGKPGFGGACPPAGDKPHRYVFTVFALKVDRLGVDPGATAAMAGFMLNANALAKTGFTVYYGR